MVPCVGIEPTIFGLQIRCIASNAYKALIMCGRKANLLQVLAPDSRRKGILIPIHLNTIDGALSFQLCFQLHNILCRFSIC